MPINKKILIITPYFAPQSHAAVFRAYKLAKYLPEFGWKPYVITVDKNYLYNEDVTLLSSLPIETEIHKAHYIEPTMRGLRMALGGKDRTFNSMKSEEIWGKVGLPQRPQTLSSVWYQYLLERWFSNPDPYWTWERSAVAKAKKVIVDNDIHLVLTSANPFTSYKIGLGLKRAGCKWVADVRDPHTYCARMHSKYFAVFKRQRRIEQLAATHADAITVASSAIGMIFSDLYGGKIRNKTYFIPTGADISPGGDVSVTDDDIGPKTPYLLFSGEYLPDYGDMFFRYYAAAKEKANAHLVPKLLFIGKKEVNEPTLLPMIQRFGLEENVTLKDQIPQRELYGLIKKALACILCPGFQTYWWCLYAKMVDYIALKKTVIAMVPDPSEARSRLMEAGLGLFLDENVEKGVERLVSFFAGKHDGIAPNDEICEQYTATRQTQAFVRLFERIAP